MDQRLLHMYEDQMRHLAYRQTRENDIFVWSAWVLLAFVGATAFVSREDLGVLLATPSGVTTTVLTLMLLTVFSVRWQLKARHYLAEHQQMLARLQDALGCFQGPVAFPKEWRGWGSTPGSLRQRLCRPTRVAATVALGIVAVISAVSAACP